MAESSQTGRLALFLKVLLDLLYFLCHVIDPFKEICALALEMFFLICTESPESLFEVVLLRCAESVDVSVGAVMVGYYQSPVGDDTCRAAEAQRHYGI